MRARVPSRSNPYWTPKEAYRAAVYWCLQYPLWLKELATLPDTSQAIRYDKDKVQSALGYDSTAELAIRRTEVESKVNLLRTTAALVMPDATWYLIRGVTEEGVKVEDLIASGMPYGKNLYLRKRQQFYHLISKRI